jgi:hypothetical protein
MNQTLTDFRQTFTATIGRDTSRTELPRHLLVLDALLAWSAGRRQLAPRASGSRADAVSFDHVDAKFTFCAVRVTRSAGATLEICPPTGKTLNAEERERVMSTLNGHSRGEPLVAGDRLRIGFGALKNVAAREAVLALMDDLLARDARPAARA